MCPIFFSIREDTMGYDNDMSIFGPFLPVDLLILLKSFASLLCRGENHFTALDRASRKQHYYQHQNLGDLLEQMKPKGFAHCCLAKLEKVKRLTGINWS